MRVISGTAKGRKLFAPKSKDIRPVLDKVKGAIFNILYNVEGLAVLDLFAGTGAVGIEALSRGAGSVIFVDNSREGAALIRKNINLCGFGNVAGIFTKSVSVALPYFSRNNQKFDLIFVDPPYLKNLVNSTLCKIAECNILSENGLIIVEHHPREAIILETSRGGAERSSSTLRIQGAQKTRSDRTPAYPQKTGAALALTDTRKYGQTRVSFLCPKR